MFIGHFALGLAAKRAAPRLSLAVLFGAAQLADILWPVLLALGLEQVRIDPGNTRFTPLDFVSYPYSHSLLLLTVWALAFGWVVRRRDARAFVVVSLLVVSHWVLDFVTHRPDMPLYPGGPKVGLGLWNSVPATVAIEVPMYAAGVWIYLRGTRPRDAVGTWAAGLLLAILFLIYLGNLSPAAVPPSVAAITAVSIAGGVLFTAWAWWADRHRTV
jgi:hypothetical protein